MWVYPPKTYKYTVARHSLLTIMPIYTPSQYVIDHVVVINDIDCMVQSLLNDTLLMAQVSGVQTTLATGEKNSLLCMMHDWRGSVSTNVNGNRSDGCDQDITGTVRESARNDELVACVNRIDVTHFSRCSDVCP